MDMKKYMDIEYIKPALVPGFDVGDQIVIQEKIDGANFSIRYDAESDSVAAFSRRKRLCFGDNLRGAWEWSQTLDKNLVHDVLGDHLILFGEWLVSHTVVYPQERYQKPYFYDVFDTATGQYYPQEQVKQIINELGLTYVPVFYCGEFISWDHVTSFVGRTELGGEYGEGVVVKNMTKLNNPNTRLPFYTKIVAERFRETKGHHESKTVDPAKLRQREELQAIVSTVVTRPRVEKILHKFVDDGLIPEQWDAHDMAVIAKNLGRELYYDCQKEEPEVVSQVGSSFGSMSNSEGMRLAREILAERCSL